MKSGISMYMEREYTGNEPHELQQSFNDVARELYDRLPAYGIKAIIRFDSQERSESWLAYVKEYMDSDRNSHLSIGERAMECYMAWMDLYEFQSDVVSSVTTIKFIDLNPDFDITPKENSIKKKQLQAELISHHGLALDEPWQRFIDLETPNVEGLRADDEYYQTYLNESLLTVEESMNERIVANQEVRDACDKVGATLMDLGNTLEIVSAVKAMQALCQRAPNDMSPQLYKGLFEVGKELHVDEKYGKQTLLCLVEFFHDRY